MIIEIIILLVLLIFSAFFSASETALMIIPDYTVKFLIRNKVKNAELVEDLKKDPKKLVTSILIGNNIVNVAASAIATKIAIDAFGNTGVGIATGVMVLIILFFGEITPKSLATGNQQKIALLVAKPIKIIMTILYPFSVFFDFVVSKLLKLFGKHKQSRMTEDEIISMLHLGSEKKVIAKEHREFMESILELDDTTVSEVATKYEFVFKLHEDTQISETAGLMTDKTYSRILVYDNNGKVTGFVHLRDILRNVSRALRLKDIQKNILEFDKDVTVGEAFEDMQDSGIHIAVIKHEHEYIGIVTMEDLLEEIFGEIHDEADITSKRIFKINKNIVIAHANTRLSSLEKYFHMKPTKESDMKIIELLTGKLDHFEPDIEIIHRNLKFKIDTLVAGKPRLVKVIKFSIKH